MSSLDVDARVGLAATVDDGTAGVWESRIGMSWLSAALGFMLLFAVWTNVPWRYAGLPESFRKAPDFGGSLLLHLPITPEIVTLAAFVLAAAAVAMIVGWQVRLAGVVAALTGWYVLGVPQMFGKVDHYHLVIWLAVVIALGLSDAVTLRVAGFLVGCVYFFPGLAKLLAGPDWWWSDHLHTIAQHERSVNGWDWPLFPAWASPALAIGAVLFELLAILGLLSRWRRPTLIVAALFHLGIGLTMGIWFWAVPIFFPALWFARPVRILDRDALRVLPLVGLVFLAGLLPVERGWPFASYPTFAGIFTFDTEVKELVDEDGNRVVDRWSWMSAPRKAGLEYLLWSEPWRLDEPTRVEPA